MVEKNVLKWLLITNGFVSSTPSIFRQVTETDVTLFPEIAFSDMFVEKISIRVLECEVIRVGDVN